MSRFRIIGSGSLFLTLLLISTTLFSQNVGERDRELFERYSEQFKGREALPFGTLITESALFFLGTPYVAHTLELEPEQLTSNLSQLDCTTFVETVIALSRTLKSGELTFENFLNHLKLMRYRTSSIEDYSSRIHYSSEWIALNEQRGLIREVGEESGGESIFFDLNIISSNPDRYKQLKGAPHLKKKIREQEIEASKIEHHYLPKGRIEELGGGLQNGDVVGFVTSIKGVDISHIGFIYWDKSKVGEPLTFIHASSKEMKVVVEKLTLQQYAQNSKTNRGVIVARPLF